LKFLGRKHDPAGAIASVKAALAVAEASGKNVRVSADLIFAVADETPETGKNEAITLADLGLTHLSCY
ncbi:MAG: coproporphyrinogen III oxidase family protein, partial [Polyangiaceae bacterium]